MDKRVREFEQRLKRLIAVSNPRGSTNLNLRLIKVLEYEIQRLSVSLSPVSDSDKQTSGTDITRLEHCQYPDSVKEELKGVATFLSQASRIIVFTGAGISTNYGIPASILYPRPTTPADEYQDFRSKKGFHKTNKGLFDIETLSDDIKRKELYQCLIEIKEKAGKFVPGHMHQLIRTLHKTGKLQRCYTQNIDGLEARIGLNTDIESADCEVVQLHGNLDFLKCTYCNHQTSWEKWMEIALSQGESIQCSICEARVEVRRIREARTNIRVGVLRPDIVLFNESNDTFGDLKAKLIDKDAISDVDSLLIIGTSLAVHGARTELLTKLIPAVRRNRGKIILVNDSPPPSAFSKPVVDHIFLMDCDLWAQGIATHEPSLHGGQEKPSLKRLRLLGPSPDKEADIRRREIGALRAKISIMEESSPLSLWMNYRERFANCQIQRASSPMGDLRASRLLQLIAAFACPDHFIALKGAIAQFRLLAPIETIQAPLELQGLYSVGMWAETFGVINTILQRLVRARFTSLIDDERSRFIGDPCETMEVHSRKALKKSVQVVVTKIYPRMKGWDNSTDLAKKSAFHTVQQNLMKWRQEGAIWSMIERKFSSLALLVLAPYHAQMLPKSQTVSGYSFQNEIPYGARRLFVDALAELRPHLSSYVPRLGNLHEILSNPATLKTRRFKIELTADSEILSATPDSHLLINAFEFVEGSEMAQYSQP